MRPSSPFHPRHRRRRRPHPPLGYDIVRTPFGQRAVPLGAGWREAAKWALWRTLVLLLTTAAALLIAWSVISSVLHTTAR